MFLAIHSISKSDVMTQFCKKPKSVISLDACKIGLGTNCFKFLLCSVDNGNAKNAFLISWEE